MLILLATHAGAETEMCLLEALADRPYTDLRCQFYLGTTAYRAAVYSVAAAHWQHVIDSSTDSDEALNLKTSARSTLAFLKYHGLGVPRNRQSAVSDWSEAAAGGSIEARRQLGSAYADAEFSGQNKVLALAWNRSLLVVHPDPDTLDEIDRSIYDEALAAIGILESAMSDLEISVARQKANELAQ